MHRAITDQRLGWRCATAEDIEAYYGRRQGPTLRAVVVTLDGLVVAVIGLARHADHAQFFSEYREELRPHLKRIPVGRALKYAQGFLRESRLPVFALAEETESDARRILGRLGFVHYDENVYVWRNSPPLSHTS